MAYIMPIGAWLLRRAHAERPKELQIEIEHIEMGLSPDGSKGTTAACTTMEGLLFLEIRRGRHDRAQEYEVHFEFHRNGIEIRANSITLFQMPEAIRQTVAGRAGDGSLTSRDIVGDGDFPLGKVIGTMEDGGALVIHFQPPEEAELIEWDELIRSLDRNEGSTS